MQLILVIFYDCSYIKKAGFEIPAFLLKTDI